MPTQTFNALLVSSQPPLDDRPLSPHLPSRFDPIGDPRWSDQLPAIAPWIGLIETPFVPEIETGNPSHGSILLDLVQRSRRQPTMPACPLWLSPVVGSGHWADALVEFVTLAHTSGQRAIANLSFELVEVLSDGQVILRDHWTMKELAALRYAHQQGVLVVVAAGNQGGDLSLLGRAAQVFDNILTVGASAGLALAHYSNRGPGLDLLAAGWDVASQTQGTSIAAVHATLAAAQVWAAHPHLTAQQAIAALKLSATPIQEGDRRYGLLNGSAAIRLAADLPVEQAQPVGEDAIALPPYTTRQGVYRERPVIVVPPAAPYIHPTHNTVVAADGQLLRTASLALGFEEPDERLNGATLYEPHWDQLKASGYNAVRLMVWKVTAASTDIRYPNGEDLYQKIDQAVEIAARKGMYIIIDYHSIKFSQDYDIEELTEFWTTVAARYRNQSHVIYEVANEPGDQSGRTVEQMNQAMYNLIRGTGADNMTILFSFDRLQGDINSYLSRVNRLTGIDWNRTAVGYHIYATSDSNADALRDRYPVMMTEMTDTVRVIQHGEGLNISWTTWSGQKLGSIQDFVYPSFRQTGLLPPYGVDQQSTDDINLIREGAAGDQYTLALTSQPTSTVTIRLNPDDQVQVSTPTLTFTPSNWNQPQTVTFTAVDDSQAEGTHSAIITHSLSSSDPNYNNRGIDPVSIRVFDDDGIAIPNTYLPPSVITTGGGTWQNLTLNLDSSVNLASLDSNDIRVVGPNGVALPVSLVSFDGGGANRSRAATYRVTAPGGTWDAGDNGAYRVTIQPNQLTTTAGAALPSTVIGSLLVSIGGGTSPTSPPSQVIISQSGGSTAVTEDGNTDTYSLVLSRQPTAPVTIALAPGAPVTLNTASLVFTPTNWNIPQTVTVTAADDSLVEGPHTATIRHTASSPDPTYDGLAIADVTVAVTDNDFPAGVIITPSGGSTSVVEGGATDSYTVALNSRPTADVEVVLNDGNQLSATPTRLMFTPQNWNVAQTVTVQAVNDTTVEGGHTGTIQHSVTSADPAYNGIGASAVTVAIADNDLPPQPIRIQAEDYNPGGQNVGYFDSTTGNQGGQYRTDRVDIQATSDSGGGFNVGWTAAGEWLKYTVTLPQSGTYDLRARLASGSSGTRTIRVFANGQDVTGAMSFSGGSGWQSWRDVFARGITLPQGNVELKVQFDTKDVNFNYFELIPVSVGEPPASMTQTQTNSSTQVTEGGNGDTVSLVLTRQPTANVTVALQPGNQLTVGASPLVFTPQNWNIAQTVTISAVDDSAVENTHSGTLNYAVSSSDPAYNGLAIAPLSVSITDNDLPPGVTLVQSGGTTAVAEGGATDSYTLRLNSRPSSNVQILLNTVLNQLGLDKTSVTFTPSNWNVAQTVTVNAVDDTLPEGSHSSAIQHVLSSLDPAYDGLAVAGVNVAIADNDLAATPLLIQAEDYRAGGRNVGYFDTTAGNKGGVYRSDDVDIEATKDSGGGYNVGWIAAGEWLTYDINLPQAGTYDLRARLASGNSGTRTIRVLVDGQDVSGAMSFSGGSGWQSWQNVFARGVTLPQGPAQLRVQFDTGLVNFNYLELIPV